MTFAEFVQPGNYNRSDGKVVCGHNIVVGPGACVECHALTDGHREGGCTCDLDAYDAEQAGADAWFEESMERARAAVASITDADIEAGLAAAHAEVDRRQAAGEGPA